MEIRSTTVPMLVAVIAGSLFVAGKYVEKQDFTPVVITVSGEGKVNAKPDIAQLQFGVTTERQRTSEAAMSLLEQKMNAILEAVKAQGIEEKDITTQALSLNPSYDWTDGTQVLRGYEAYQTLSVKVRDTDKSGAVLQAATTAGANQVGGVNFTIDDPSALQEEARQKAIADAEEKAQALAEQLGGRLGKLRGYSEGGGYTPPYMPYAAREMDMANAVGEGAPVPVPTGEQEVQLSVSLTYELK